MQFTQKNFKDHTSRNLNNNFITHKKFSFLTTMGFGTGMEVVRLQSPITTNKINFTLTRSLDQTDSEDDSNIRSFIRMILTGVWPFLLPYHEATLQRLEAYTVDSFNEAVNTYLTNSEYQNMTVGENSVPVLENGFLRIILDECYRSSVLCPAKLNTAPRNSSLTYGELSFNLTRDIIDTISKCNLDKGGIFLDLGSGVGQVVMQCAASFLWSKCVGIEIDPLRAQYAKNYLDRFKEYQQWFGAPVMEIELIEGDFLQFESQIQEATTIFVNNIVFTEEVNNALSRIWMKLKDGTKILSTRCFVNDRSTSDKLNMRRLNAVDAILKMDQCQVKGEVSWCAKHIEVFFQRVDRRECIEFLKTLDLCKSMTPELIASLHLSMEQMMELRTGAHSIFLPISPIIRTKSITVPESKRTRPSTGNRPGRPRKRPPVQSQQSLRKNIGRPIRCPEKKIQQPVVTVDNDESMTCCSPTGSSHCGDDEQVFLSSEEMQKVEQTPQNFQQQQFIEQWQRLKSQEDIHPSFFWTIDHDVNGTIIIPNAVNKVINESCHRVDKTEEEKEILVKTKALVDDWFRSVINSSMEATLNVEHLQNPNSLLDSFQAKLRETLSPENGMPGPIYQPPRSMRSFQFSSQTSLGQAVQDLRHLKGGDQGNQQGYKCDICKSNSCDMNSEHLMPQIDVNGPSKFTQKL